MKCPHFVADSAAQVDATHAAAMVAGATDIGRAGSAALLRSALLCRKRARPRRLQRRVRLQELAALPALIAKRPFYVRIPPIALKNSLDCWAQR